MEHFVGCHLHEERKGNKVKMDTSTKVKLVELEKFHRKYPKSESYLK
jgi:hypothetical protein